MFTISNDELNKLPEIVVKGMLIEHQHEDGSWEEAEMEYGTNTKTGEESSTLGCYTLKNGVTYLGCIGGKLLSRPTLRLKIGAISNN